MKKMTMTIKIILAVLAILIILCFALLAGKFTTAYMGADIEEYKETEGITTASGDTLIFSRGDSISLSASTDNFTTGKGNLTSTTNPSVRLISSDKTNNATATYTVGFIIYKNTYKYSTPDKTAELILTILDENNNPVIEAENLDYVTVNGISGFDITEKTGTFNIVTNKSISTTSSVTGTTHKWTYTLTFINLETDQSINETGILSMTAILQEKALFTTIEEACAGQNMANCIKENIYLTSSLYFHDEYLVNGAEDLSYRYSGREHEALGNCTFQGESVYNFNFPESIYNKSTYNECQKIYKFEDSEGSSYYDSSVEKIFGHLLGNLETEVEYIGAGNWVETNSEVLVNNYVCFGSEATQCPDDYLYRIIGIFDEDKDGTYNVKLIKYDYATSEQLGTNGEYDNLVSVDWSGEIAFYQGSNFANIAAYHYDSTYYLIWSTSELNTINLNENYISYLNSLGSQWTTKIADTTWQVGRNTVANIAKVTPKVAYANEIIKPETNIKYNAQIGLMYVSDYGYAASQENWTLPLYSESSTDYSAAAENNWMYMGLMEWTITRSSDYFVHYVDIYGRVSNHSTYSHAVRPVFYLNSDVTLVSGSGTQTDPFRIN